ncbi:beta-galactosidase [Bacillus licheniformis]|nr:beta-galactosidase [Bacillus licheniformis]
MKAEAVSSYALGGAAFCYWLWRQQRAGSEQPHGSVLSAWGSLMWDMKCARSRAGKTRG